MRFIPDQVEHGFGRSKVAGRVEQEQKAIGIIDKDPLAGELEYLKEYDEKDTIGSIKLLVRRDDDGERVIRRAIQLSPRLEDWLYEAARRNRIPPEKFGLPDDPEEFHRMSLKPKGNNQKIQKFLVAFNRAKDDEISTLRKWIREAVIE